MLKRKYTAFFYFTLISIS